jgi:methionyl-tRNA formyltransferase
MKNQKQKKIAFLGTMEIASFFLDKFLKNPEFDVQFVVTKPDSNKERTDLLHYISLSNLNLKVYRPKKITELDPAVFQALDAVVVIAYGEKIPATLLKLTKWINVHASILPSLRGASPIQYAIFLGFQKTGITLILMDEKIDAGAIIGIKEVEIKEKDTFTSLSCRIGMETSSWALEIINKFLNGEVTPEIQDHGSATKAPLIKKEFRVLDWSLPADILEGKVRALNPSPYALAIIGSFTFKVIEANVLYSNHDENLNNQPGDLLSEKKLVIQTGYGIIHLTRLIPSGKRSMTDEEFLRGARLR